MNQPERPLRVGFIGTGRKMERPGPMGFAMAYQHAAGYKALPPGTVELAACADISRENGEAFKEAIGIGAYYSSHTEMLASERLDVVSVCVWPHLHAPMVVDCARAGKRQGRFIALAGPHETDRHIDCAAGSHLHPAGFMARTGDAGENKIRDEPASQTAAATNANVRLPQAPNRDCARPTAPALTRHERCRAVCRSPR